MFLRLSGNSDEKAENGTERLTVPGVPEIFVIPPQSDSGLLKNGSNAPRRSIMTPRLIF